MTSRNPVPRLPAKQRRDLLLLPLRILNVLLRRDRGAIRHLRPWLRSLAPGVDPLSLDLPWIAFDAIEWLRQNLRSDWRVLELGSGGSTAFFSSRVSALVSFEHNPDWFAQVQNHIDSQIPFDYRLLPEGEYVDALSALDHEPFDLILVDGGSDRAAAILKSRSLLKPGGYLMLDNSDAPNLGTALEGLNDLHRTDFFGIAPWNLHKGRLYLQQTTIWRIPN
jgi:hypothetical protein